MTKQDARHALTLLWQRYAEAQTPAERADIDKQINTYLDFIDRTAEGNKTYAVMVDTGAGDLFVTVVNNPASAKKVLGTLKENGYDARLVETDINVLNERWTS